MKIQRRRLLQASVGGAILGLSGCASVQGGGQDSDPTSPGADSDGGSGRIGDGELTLATTTSTYDTGLLDKLNPVFEADYGVTLKTVPKGTGASLRTARDGDADVVLVHARPAENEFMLDGFGLNRRDVMFNDFVIVGPEDDPAGINGMESVRDALGAIAATESEFVSRGDDSGTHKKELELWRTADVERDVAWYLEIGQGMGQALTQTDELGAYTLSDRGTFLSMRSQLDLTIHVQGPLEGGPAILKNPYGIMAVNPAKYDDLNYEAAMAYIGFLTGPTAQAMIEDYTVEGTRLFYPNAISEEPNFEQYVPQGATDQVSESLSGPDSRGSQPVNGFSTLPD